MTDHNPEQPTQQPTIRPEDREGYILPPRQQGDLVAQLNQFISHVQDLEARVIMLEQLRDFVYRHHEAPVENNFLVFGVPVGPNNTWPGVTQTDIDGASYSNINIMDRPYTTTNHFLTVGIDVSLPDPTRLILDGGFSHDLFNSFEKLLIQYVRGGNTYNIWRMTYALVTFAAPRRNLVSIGFN